MSTQKPSLILFDCDGTLVDSEGLYNSVIAEMLTEHGLQAYNPAYCLAHFNGLTLTTIRQTVEADTGHDLSGVLTSDLYIRRAQARMDEGLLAIDGAGKLLEWSASRGKIALASNGERSSVIKSLKITGLYDFFGEERIFTKIEVPRPKPFPDLFLHAAARMDTNPADCVVIEDSLAGVEAGYAAKMRVFGFTGVHHTPDLQAKKLMQAGAERVFSALIHIPEALRDQK